MVMTQIGAKALREKLVSAGEDVSHVIQAMCRREDDPKTPCPAALWTDGVKWGLEEDVVRLEFDLVGRRAIVRLKDDRILMYDNVTEDDMNVIHSQEAGIFQYFAEHYAIFPEIYPVSVAG